MDHSYEEIRAAALDVLAGRETAPHEPTQYEGLKIDVAAVFSRRESTQGGPEVGRHGSPQLSVLDRERFLEVFWGLFREGVITLGLNDSNREFPFFRVTEFGRRLLGGDQPYFFHDVSSYAEVITREVPEVDEVTLLYLKEAMQAFKAGCLLSATVMLGVAAEHTFLLLAEAADGSASCSQWFANVAKQRTILQRLNKFKNALDQHQRDLPSEIKEDLDTHFLGVQSLIRTFRNQAGHPTGEIVTREQAYVLLQLFVPYCKKMYQMMAYFSQPAT